MTRMARGHDTANHGPMPNLQQELLVILGSGPAAWTAALYASRANLRPMVYEGGMSREMIPGGQLMWTTEVENYPGFPEGIGGQELMERMKAQAIRFDTRVETDDIEEVDLSHRPFRLKPRYGDWVEAQTVVIATGARANWLGLENEERLARSGGGVSACAVCDGALPAFRDQRLLVVGGGDSAVEESTYLTKYASEVVLIHRRDSLRASPIMAERAMNNPEIRIEWNTRVVDVRGDDFVTGVVLEDVVTGTLREMQAGGLFIAIGHTPNTDFLGGQVELTPHGYIVTRHPWRTETSVPGVFAAGDVMDDYYRQAVTAAGTGCMAALEAERFLAHHGIAEARIPVLETAEVPTGIDVNPGGGD